MISPRPDHWLSLAVVLLLAAMLAACAAPVPPLVTSSPSPTLPTTPAGRPTVAVAATPCTLEPIIPPTPPPVTYGFAELDPTTGLHVTGSPQQIELASYRLVVTGTVKTPLSLTLDELRCLPRVEQRCTLVCPETFEDTTTWAGVRLWQVLELAGLPEEVSSIRLVGADGYGAWVPVSIARAEDSLLAYEWSGEPLPILHGFPLRGVFPAAPGYVWVKWLVRIEVK